MSAAIDLMTPRGDAAAHLGLVRAVARGLSYRPWYLDFDDILQDGAVGLCRALRRWDPGRGVAWPSYATVAIRGAIQEGLRASRPMGPRDTRWSGMRAPQIVGLGLPVSGALRSGESALTVEEATADEHAVDPADAACDADLLRRLGQAVDALPDRLRRVVLLRYRDGLSQPAIARRLGVCHQRVGQLLQRAHRMLRAQLGPSDPGRLEGCGHEAGR